jgi:hypothetical protein
VTFARSAPTAQSAPDCSVSGCARPAECSGLCAMHRKRAQRGTDPGKPVQQKLSPWGRLFEAFTQMLEAETAAEDDADFARLEARAYKAAQRWAEHGCPLPASMQLADSVPRVVDAVAARTVPRTRHPDALEADAGVQNRRAQATSSRPPTARARSATGAQVVRGDRRRARHLAAVGAQPGDDGARRDPDEDGRRRRKGARS